MALDFTTLARVAARIKPGETTLEDGVDTLLGQMITATSAAAEAYLGRVVLAGSQTEYHDVPAGARRFRLRAFPCTAFTSAHYDPDQAFGSDTALTSDDYYSPTLGDASTFVLRDALSGGDPNEVEPNALKLVYTGGMAATTSSFITAYPDLAAAVEIQVVHDYLRKLDLGTTGADVPSRASIAADFWIDEALALLQPHRRINGG